MTAFWYWYNLYHICIDFFLYSHFTYSLIRNGCWIYQAPFQNLVIILIYFSPLFYESNKILWLICWYQTKCHNDNNTPANVQVPEKFPPAEFYPITTISQIPAALLLMAEEGWPRLCFLGRKATTSKSLKYHCLNWECEDGSSA